MKRFRKLFKRVKRLKFVLANLPILIALAGFLIFIVIIIGIIGGGGGNENGNGIVTYENLSESTLKWLEAVTKECNEQGVPELIPYVMAVIEVESKGQGIDIMQCAASAGVSSFSDALQSIKQGVKYLKSNHEKSQSLGVNDIWAAIQGYNFGSGYLNYLANNKKVHSISVAEVYSKTVVAPSLGNSSGSTYSYVNAVSQAHGKTYLYRNGGNYYYSTLVGQYIGTSNGNGVTGSDMYEIIMKEALKYQGNPYVWSGASPSKGFDCSGLIQYCYGIAGFNLPRTAAAQHPVTKSVSLSEAKPGDLIFFKDTYKTGISHVGIYIDSTTMYHAGSSAGINYANWNTAYYQKHFDSIHRVEGVN